MPQVTLYLDDETDRRGRAAAAAAGMSYSKWLGGLVRASTDSSWPEAVRALAGAVRDFPLADELYRVDAKDVPREPLE